MRARLYVLPCDHGFRDHYYCEACFEQLEKRLPVKPFDGPDCRKESSLPAGGAAELPQLGQNVRRIGGVKDPWGIAINDKQELIVAGSACTGDCTGVTIMQRDGQVVRTIEHPNIKDPCGVATSADGSIFITDEVVQCLFKLNREGTLIKTVEGSNILNKFEQCFSVKVIQNQLYVVDCTNCLVNII